MALAAVFAFMASIGITSPAAAAAGVDATIFGSTVPAIASDADAAAVELGVVFVPRVSGAVSGVRFYKGSANAGVHVGTLWKADGSRLATATFTAETVSGWQTVNFAAAVAVTAGQKYVASYNAPRGRYAAATNFFRTAFTQGDLSMPGNGGVYRYGSTAFPTSTYESTNYYVDVVFRPSVSTPLPPDTRAPVISQVSATGATQSGITIKWATDELANGKVVYGTSSSYGSSTALVTSFTSSHSLQVSGLAPATTYHYQVRSTDASGNGAAGSDAVFTTASVAAFNPGNPAGSAPVPAGMGAEDVHSPDHVIGDGTSASCTSAAVLSAAAAGGIVTFNCGPTPTTIVLTQTIKVMNSTRKLVIDGGGKVTLSGGEARRILYIDTCDRSLGTVSDNCLYSPSWPQVTVQNVTLADGNATTSTYVPPGDTDQGSNGGGAIFALGGRLKVVKSSFIRNVCASNGPDLGGGAIRVLAQHSPTPDSLDASQAARNQDPVYVVQSTFGGASGQSNSCSNGGAISSLRTPVTVLNSLLTYNNAVGCCSNPANAGTPGGGSGGAVYSDGDTYDLHLAGSVMEHNTAKAGGSAVFFVSNDRTGHLVIDGSVSRYNTYAPSGQPSDPHFQNYPGIFYIGSGNPTFTNSTIQ